jgi:hypothetical protein
MRLIKVVCSAAVLVACLTPGARADVWNKKTILTFSAPVQVPGTMLPSGTYVFKLADLTGNRHVVQIFDKDERHIYRTILAIPDSRLKPTDKPVVLFSERPAGSPQAVKAWFYPGESIGNEFVYPRNQAMRIAKETHQSVLSMDEPPKLDATDAERMDSMRGATVRRVDENGQSPTVATDRGVEAPRAAVTGRTASTATNSDARLKNGSSARVGGDARNKAVGTSGQADSTASRRRLPQTASKLPMFELLSGLALAAGLGVRCIRRLSAGR